MIRPRQARKLTIRAVLPVSINRFSMSDENSGEEYLLELFDQFDANDDGLIDRQEFMRILRVLGDEPSEDILSLEFAAIDVNGDGMVDFEEFRRWWLDYK